MKSLKVRVEGRVQGVCFRYYAQQEANRLGIKGWVRNCPDGCVETLIYGSEPQLSTMLAWLKHGPSSAIVTQTHIEPASLHPLPTGFNITY